MQVFVRPAKRLGNRSQIFDAPISATDIKSSSDVGVSITIVARNYYGDGSTYRYELHLTGQEAELLSTAAKRKLS